MDVPRASAAILRDAAQARLLRMREAPVSTEKIFIVAVNAMFTTFMRVRFTNVFDGAARN
jgi:hypothetical protein